MRLWSLHPKYLDARGLVALWRETLLAKAVLQGKTRGYRHHPQLARFRAHRSPRLAINAYLAAIHAEATARGYAFDAAKVGPQRPVAAMAVTTGQLLHEWHHLQRKLALRSPATRRKWMHTRKPEPHPLFRRRPGTIAAWERAGQGTRRPALRPALPPRRRQPVHRTG